MADNAMAKRKMTKTQTMIYKTLHIHKNTNNDLQNTSLKTNNDLQNTTQKTKD